MSMSGSAVGTMETLNYEGSSSGGSGEEETCSAGEVDTGSNLPLWEAALATLILSFLIISTILGNALVILSVFTYRPLRIVQNFFIVSLAVADLAVAILVMPFNVAYLILGKWIFGIHLCKLWLTCDVLCCTASILNLCAIALDRFWAITDPINYAQKRTLKRVLGTIAGVWVLSGAISSPPLAGWNDWPEELEPGTPCQLTRRKGYVVYSALGSFFVPLLIMSLVYLEIFLATRRRLRERARQSRLGPVPSGARKDTDDIEESVSSETNHNEKSTPRSQAKPSLVDDEPTEAQMGTTPPKATVVINDIDNDIANKSVTNSLKALKDKNPDKLGQVYVAQINVTDSKETLDSICAVWKSAIQENEQNIPDFILDTTTYGAGAETVNRFTALLGIPTLSAQFGQEGDLLGWREITDEQKQYLVQVMNPADLMPEVIRQQCSMYNISNAAILFDDHFVMDHKYKSLLLNVPTRHVIVHTKEPGAPLQRQISNLRDLDIVNFFVLGGETTITAALQAANNLKFTGHKYGWFVIILSEDFTPRCNNCRNVSVMVFKPQISQNQQQLNELASIGSLPKPLISSAFYYDLTRLGVLAMKAAVDAGEWRRPRFIECAAYNENETLPARNISLRKRLEQVSAASGFMPTYAGFIWGNNGESRAKFEANAFVVQIRDSKLVNEETVETWQAGIDSPLNVLNEAKAGNHTAVTSYRVVTVIKPPFVMRDNVTGNWSGYCIDLLDEIRQSVNFEYDIWEVEDKEYGNMDEEGNWNGMVKELKEKRADIALGALAVMAERENVIDYTVPYYDLVGISILRRKPKTTTSLFKFLTVLETDVWLCILGAYFFTSLLMWVFDKFSPYSYQNNREKYKDDDEKREFTLKECLWFCMTSLTPQGGGEAPKNLSGRLVAATWWLFGFIIIASYTANLAAFLTVSRLETPVESLEDLSKQYKIQYAPILNSSEYRYFERMANIEKRFYEIWKDMSLNDSLSDVERSKLAVWDYPVSDKYTKMFQTMRDTGFPKDIDDALARVRKDGPTEFAFIGDATDIKYLIMTNCEFMQVGEEFSRKPYAIAVQQGSPLKDQFNNAILMMLNRRKLEKLKDQWWNKNPEKKNCNKAEDQSDGISIQNIGGVFIVIFVGIGLACITLVFEYYYYRYRPQMNQQHKDRNSKAKTAHSIKSMKFNLRPAPTQTLETNEYGSRF